MLVCAGDTPCPNEGLVKTLDALAHVSNKRSAQFFDCSLYAEDLKRVGKSFSDLPPIFPLNLQYFLSDGDLRNGEFFGASILEEKGLLRVAIAVLPCSHYKGMRPAWNSRVGGYLYFADYFVGTQLASELCALTQAWCDDCN